jgi:pimeloyl-ACP methyl ester carboxylesterase
MLLLPPVFPFSLLVGLLALALPVAGGWLVWAWATGVVAGTGYLLAGIGLVAWSLAGRWLVLLLCGRAGAGPPRGAPAGVAAAARQPGGPALHVEAHGPPDGPPLVLTHGWGTDRTEWGYAVRRLADRFRVVTWDLRGLGRSARPAGGPHGGYALEAMAGDLAAVLDAAGGRPAVLVGHSIGGMVLLTFCRRFPERLGRDVAGLVLVNTTSTDPVRTTSFAPVFRALRGPLLVPLLYLVQGLWPAVWAANWLSYANGTAHLLAALSGFAGAQTRAQLELAARLSVRASPAVLAPGVRAMFAYDAEATLARLPVPVLVVTGDRDRVLVPEASARMRDAIPGAALVALAPAGHMALLEQHEAFGDALAAFATAVAARPPAPPPEQAVTR